jgi:hypothetical protein
MAELGSRVVVFSCKAQNPRINMSEAKFTTDHQEIRHWAEKRGGQPTTVSGTGAKGEAGILRLDFKPKDEALDRISWDDFFEKFDSAHLAFLYQDKTADGKMSRFHKFVDRSEMAQKSP